jgi:hypothetical protein
MRLTNGEVARERIEEIREEEFGEIEFIVSS